jgi:hypothetical protein
MPIHLFLTTTFVKRVSLLLLLASTLFITPFAKAQAQEAPKINGFSLHAGINSGILSGGTGPSFSLHYAGRRDKVFQLESQLFFDYHSGSTFLSGFDQKNTGLGLVGGVRVNFLPKKNCNPSLFLMPGLMYSSQTISRPSDPTQQGISGAISIGVSNLFHQKHMVSVGINEGANISSLFLKYGYWF